jgi:translation initiation factor IF-2
MSKYRIYQLAKEFSLDSKKIIDILNKNNTSWVTFLLTFNL